jgi:hypothetical protein
MKDDKNTMSRAGMIEKILVAPIAIGAFAALCAEADAAPTMTQAAAGYKDHTSSSKKCSDCVHYIPASSNPTTAAGTCNLVKGSIKPGGTCNLWTAKPK